MEKSIFEQTGGTYTLGEGGMYYPDLKLPTDEEPRYGKYGRIRKTFLQKHRHGLYWELLLNGRLVKHLNELDAEAHEQVEFLIRQMAEKQGISENLKAHDQMTWVGRMNNIKNAAEEIVLSELIYTTNAIEGFNRQLRKVTKAKSVFPTDESLFKMLYLAMMDITKKWTGRRQDWSMIHAQLAVYFEDRMPD